MVLCLPIGATPFTGSLSRYLATISPCSPWTQPYKPYSPYNPYLQAYGMPIKDLNLPHWVGLVTLEPWQIAISGCQAARLPGCMQGPCAASFGQHLPDLPCILLAGERYQRPQTSPFHHFCLHTNPGLPAAALSGIRGVATASGRGTSGPCASSVKIPSRLHPFASTNAAACFTRKWILS